MTRPAPIIVGTLAVLTLLFGTYMGSYYALLFDARNVAIPLSQRPGWAELVAAPVYRVESEPLVIVLLPAHQLDRLIRPRYWGDE